MLARNRGGEREGGYLIGGHVLRGEGRGRLPYRLDLSVFA